MKTIMRLGITVAKAFYGKGMARFPFLIWFWEFFCSKVVRFDRMRVEAQGMRLWIDPADMGCGIGLIVQGETFEDPMVRFFRGVLTPGMQVIDVGANIGFFSVLASGLVGENGGVHAFEPNRYNYGFLTSNIEENGARNVTPVPKAVSNEPGSVKLYLYPHCRSGSARGRIIAADRGWKSIDVEATTIDAYCSTKGIPLQLLKMDVEGVEEMVFLGMRETVRRNPELIIVMEFVPNLLQLVGTDPERFLNSIMNEGFSLYNIGEEMITPLSNSRRAMEVCMRAGGMNICCARQPLPEVLFNGEGEV